MRIDPADIREETSFPGGVAILTWNCPGCGWGLFRPCSEATRADIEADPLCGHCATEHPPGHRGEPAKREQLPLFGEP